MGRTRRWLEALADHEAKNNRSHGTAATYGCADNDAQDKGPKKYSEALEWATDKTDKNLDWADTEVVDETLAHRAKAEGQVASDKASAEMCRHEVSGGCWLCHKQGRFPSTEEREEGAA